MNRDSKAVFDQRRMTEQGITYEDPTFYIENPSYNTARREEPQLGKTAKKQCPVSDRWVSASALVVATIALVVAVALAALWKSDCSCNEGAATQQVRSRYRTSLSATVLRNSTSSDYRIDSHSVIT